MNQRTERHYRYSVTTNADDGIVDHQNGEGTDTNGQLDHNQIRNAVINDLPEHLRRSHHNHDVTIEEI